MSELRTYRGPGGVLQKSQGVGSDAVFIEGTTLNALLPNTISFFISEVCRPLRTATEQSSNSGSSLEARYRLVHQAQLGFRTFHNFIQFL